ncbi:hypothetical protein SLEP1_g4354 [Rubroshorea leprosula]|uniref:Uncharacterized protein n=1 Tax=Rubroshorea leprosula TaxID=152421 RepID=A0AAV5HUE6_9ROSI|nr:hypothetical protein SLEP1_g4354 [Rubroshorea leprosula]
MGWGSKAQLSGTIRGGKWTFATSSANLGGLCVCV